MNAENIKTSIDAVATVKAIHDWDEPEYEWADDNSSVTARRVCKGDESHTETETVNTTSRIIKEATENETGIKSYKAVFTNPAFTEQTKNVDIPKTDGHGGKTGTYRVPKTGVETVLDMKIYKTQSESAGGK